MIIGDEYQSRTSDIIMTITKLTQTCVSAKNIGKFCISREDDCLRDVFNRLYKFTGVNKLTGAPVNISKNMMMGER